MLRKTRNFQYKELILLLQMRLSRNIHSVMNLDSILKGLLVNISGMGQEL